MSIASRTSEAFGSGATVHVTDPSALDCHVVKLAAVVRRLSLLQCGVHGNELTEIVGAGAGQQVDRPRGCRGFGQSFDLGCQRAIPAPLQLLGRSVSVSHETAQRRRIQRAGKANEVVELGHLTNRARSQFVGIHAVAAPVELVGESLLS